MEMVGAGGSWMYSEGAASRVGSWPDCGGKETRKGSVEDACGFPGITLHCVRHARLPTAT